MGYLLCCCWFSSFIVARYIHFFIKNFYFIFVGQGLLFARQVSAKLSKFMISGHNIIQVGKRFSAFLAKFSRANPLITYVETRTYTKLLLQCKLKHVYLIDGRNMLQKNPLTKTSSTEPCLKLHTYINMDGIQDTDIFHFLMVQIAIFLCHE